MQCKIPQPTKKHADSPGYKCSLVLKAQLGLHMIPELHKVEFIESWEEEEKVAIKKPKAPAPAPKKEGEAPAEGEAKEEAKPAAPETEQDFEIKMRKKTTSKEIALKDRQSHAYPPDTITTMKGLEESLTVEDRKILDVKEAKNELEAFCYDMRSNLDSYGNYEHFINPAEKAPFVA